MISPEKFDALTEQCRQAYGDISAQQFARLFEPFVSRDPTAREALTLIRTSGGTVEVLVWGGKRRLHIDADYFPPSHLHAEIGEIVEQEQKLHF